MMTRAFQERADRLHPALAWLATFGFVNAAWIFFRADSMRDAAAVFYRIMRLRFGEINASLLEAFDLPELRRALRMLRLPNPDNLRIILLFFTAGALAAVLGMRNAAERAARFRPTALSSAMTAVLLVWCVLSFSGVSVFLYFNF
jgi:alginate O-acetyltransferase complex protein AlgI